MRMSRHTYIEVNVLPSELTSGSTVRTLSFQDFRHLRIQLPHNYPASLVENQFYLNVPSISDLLFRIGILNNESILSNEGPT